MSLLRSYLEANSILSPAQLEAATRHQQAQGGSLDTALLELGLLSAGDLDLHLGRACGLPTVPARLLETGPTRPWGHVPKALLDIGWAMPLALEDGHVLVAVHPDLPDARLGQLYRQIRGFMPMVAPECCLAKLAAERSNGIVAPRFAMLMLDLLDALQQRESEADTAVPEDRSTGDDAPADQSSTAATGDRPASDSASDQPAASDSASDQPASDQPASDQPTSDQPTSDRPASDSATAMRVANLGPGDTLLLGRIRRPASADDPGSSGSFPAAHESGSFSASNSGSFPDLRSVGAHAPGTRHGPQTAAEPASPSAIQTAAGLASPSAIQTAAELTSQPVSPASPAAPIGQPVAPASPVAPAGSSTSPGSLAARARQLLSPPTYVAPAGSPVSSASPSIAPASPTEQAPPSAQPVAPASLAAQVGSPVSSASQAPAAPDSLAAQVDSPVSPAIQAPASQASIEAAAAHFPRHIDPGSSLSAPVTHEPGRAAELMLRLAPARAALAEARERDQITGALVYAAAQIAPRVALFGVRRDGLRVLAVPGALHLPSSLIIPIPDGGLLDRAVLGLIRLKLLTEPRLAAAVGRPLGIPCLFEPVFAQDRGVLMLYIDRDGGLFDAADHAAMRGLCDLASTNLEALLRTRGVANARPTDPAAAPTGSSHSEPSPATSSGAPVPPSSPAATPEASAPVPTDSSATPVPTDSSAAPVPTDSSETSVPTDSSATPVPTDSRPATDLSLRDESPTEPAGASATRPRSEADAPQLRPGRAARTAKRQVISLINPIRRDNSGGHSAPPIARAEPRSSDTTPAEIAKPQFSSRPLVSSSATDSPADDPNTATAPASQQSVPTDSLAADPGAVLPALTRRPSSEPLPAPTPSATSASQQPVPTDSLAADPGAVLPALTRRPSSEPLPAPTPSATPASQQPVPTDSLTADRDIVLPALTLRPPSEPLPAPSAAPASPQPVPTDSPTADRRTALPAVTRRAASEPFLSPAVLAGRPTPRPAQPSISGEIGELKATTPAEAQPGSVPTETSPEPVPTDSLATPALTPGGLHLPNLVAPPGSRRGLGKRGDRARPSEPGMVMPDLRRASDATPVLSIPTSLIAPTPLPGAQRRGSRTGLNPVPPSADEVTLNMPLLVRKDAAAPAPEPAEDLSPGTATTATESAEFAGTIPADLTQTPAPGTPAATSPPGSQPVLETSTDTSEAAMDPTATELSAETSATDAVVEAIADAMIAAARAAEREDYLSSERAPPGVNQAATLGSDTATPPDADELLEAYLNDPNDTEARTALTQLGPQGLARVAARFPGPIDLGDQTNARSFPPPSAHGPLLRACVEIGPAITPYILELLEYPRPQLRFYAAFVFQELRDPRCLRSLAQHAFDPDADVRLIATRVLESYSRVEGFIAATELVRAELRSRDRERALLAAEAAGTLRDTQAVYTLIELLSVRDKQVRETALEALCSITAKHLGYRPAKWRAWYDEHGQETRVEWVIEALRHRDAAVRRWAADELVRITGHHVTAPDGEKLTAKFLFHAWQQWWMAGAADRNG